MWYTALNSMPGHRPPPPPDAAPPPPPPPPALLQESIRERLEREAEGATDPTRRAALCTALAEFLHDDAAAVEVLERACDADPSYLPPLEALYRIHRRNDDREALERVAWARASVTPEGPRRAEVLVDLAEVLEDLSGDPAGADEAHRQALREDPGCRSAWMALERRAAAQSDSRQLGEALEGLARATTDDMRKGLLLVDAARLAIDDEEPDRAISLCREATKLEAGRWRALVELERIAERVDRADVLSEALLARAALATGLVSLTSGPDPDASAVAHVESADHAAALAVWLRRRAARVLLDRVGDAQAAEIALEEAAKVWPDDPLVAQDRLHVYEAQGRLEDVREVLATDLTRAGSGPAAAALRCRLADLSLRAGDADAARTHLETALQAHPESVAARALLEEWLARAGEVGVLAGLYAADAEKATGPERAFSATVAADLFTQGAKDPERGLAAWERAAGADPDGDVGIDAARARIDLLRRLDRPTDLAAALASLADAEVAPGEAATLLREVALLRAQTGDMDGAAAAADGAARNAPDALWPRLLQCLVRLRSGDRPRAAASLLEGATLAGEDAVAAALAAGAAMLISGERAVEPAREARDRAPGDAFAAAFHLEIVRRHGDADEGVAALSRLADRDGERAQACLLEAALLSERAGRPASEAADLLRGAAEIGASDWTAEALLAHARTRGDDEEVGEVLARRASADGADARARLEAAEWIELCLRRPRDAAALYAQAEAGETWPEDPAFPGKWSTSPGGAELAQLADAVVSADVPALAGPLAATALSLAAPAGVPLVDLEMLAAAALRGDSADPTALLWSARLAAARGDLGARPTALEALPTSAASIAAELLARRVAGAPPSEIVATARRLHALSPRHPALAITLSDALAPGEEPAARLTGLRLLREMSGPVDRGDLDVEIGQTLEALDRAAEAQAAFRSAIEAHGDDLGAIEGLRRTMRRSGEPAELIELTEKAAALVGDVPEAAPLWEEVGLLLEDALGKPTRAERAYAKALSLDVMRAEAYRRIHVLLEDRGGFDELGELLARRSAVVDDPEKLVPLLVEGAAVAAEREDPEAALQVLEEVLLLDSEHLEALSMKARILTEVGEHGSAVDAYLAEAAVAPPEGKRRARGGAAKLLAGPLAEPKRAFEVLLDLEGEGALETEDLEAAVRIAREAKLLDEELAALRKIAEIHPDASGRADAHRRAFELLEAQGRPEDAAAELRRLLGHVPDDEAALTRHAEIVIDPVVPVAPLDAAEARLRQRLAEDPVADEALALLGRVHAWHGDRDAHWLVLTLREALGIASDAEHAEVAVHEGAAPEVPGASVSPERIDRALSHPDDAGSLRSVLDAIAPFLGKYYDLSPKRVGVRRSDRISPKAASPLRDRIQAWADALGAPELELYQGGEDPERILPVPGDPPALVVGPAVTAAPSPKQRFALGRALVRIRWGRAALHERDEEELALLLWAATRIGGSKAAPERPEIAEAEKRLTGVLPRKVRHGLASLVSGLDSSAETMTVVRAERASADRGGLLCCGDVRVAVVEVGQGGYGRELVRFAVSRELATLRRELGLAIQ